MEMEGNDGTEEAYGDGEYYGQEGDDAEAGMEGVEHEGDYAAGMDGVDGEAVPEGIPQDEVTAQGDEEATEPAKKRGGHGRRKIEIEYIDDKIRRHITFSKRKAGISKKAYELSRLTGAQVASLTPRPTVLERSSHILERSPST